MNAQQEAMNNRLRDAAEQIAETLQKTTELLQEAKQPLIQRHEELCQAYADAEDRVQAAPEGSTEQRYAEAERDLYNAWIARGRTRRDKMRTAQNGDLRKQRNQRHRDASGERNRNHIEDTYNNRTTDAPEEGNDLGPFITRATAALRRSQNPAIPSPRGTQERSRNHSRSGATKTDEHRTEATTGDHPTRAEPQHTKPGDQRKP